MRGFVKGAGTVIGALALLAAAATPASAAQSVTVVSFDDLEDEHGTTIYDGDNPVLTYDANQSGGISDLEAALDYRKSFSSRFVFQIERFGINDLGEGLTFTIRSQSSGVLGQGGSGLGYKGIDDSVAVEFDTSAGTNDPVGDQHVAFLTDGNVNRHLGATKVKGGLDGQPRTGWVDYDARRKRLELYLSKSDKKPKKPLTSAKIDLSKHLRFDGAYVEFTGGTSESVSLQEIQDLEVRQKLPSTEIRYPDFASFKGLQLNKAANVIDDAVRLTPDKINRRGSFFTKEAFIPTNRSFSSAFSFDIETAGDPADAADGLAFVLQPGKATTIGGGSNGLGYIGIKPSLGVAFTTFQASDPAGEVGIWENGKTETGTGLPSPVVGGVRYAWVDYDAPSNIVDVYYSDTPDKPADPIVSEVVDLTKLGRKARAGFTAATGGFSASHDILSLNVESGLAG